MITTIGRIITESVIPNNVRVGGYYLINGKPCKIVAGRYWGDYGLSNFWWWREVGSSGRLGKKGNGYGGNWKPITMEEAKRISRKADV